MRGPEAHGCVGDKKNPVRIVGEYMMIEKMQFVERYYLEEVYKNYLEEKETISDIADSMIMQYISAFSEALDA